MPAPVVELFVWICVVWGAATSLPQFFRLMKARTSAGLSLMAWWVWCAAGGAWTVHGILARTAIMILPNLIGLVTASAILWLIQRDRRLPAWRVWLAPALIIAVGVVLRLTLGPVVFGLFMIVPQTIAMLGQLVDLVRCPDLSGVSHLYLWVALGLQLVWLVYAIGKPDTALIISAGGTGALALLNLVWYLLRRSHVVRPMFVS